MADAQGDRPDRDPGVRPDARAGSDPLRRKGEADAWNAVSLVLAGMVLWGGVGWLVGRWLSVPALTGVGLVVGTGGGLALVWLRYGRQT
jgi:hypothetical protein